MNRGQCLDRAKEIVHHNRNSEYGEPEDNFGDIAAYWTTFLRKKLKTNVKITTPDVAIMSALIKVSRLQNTPGHEDSWVDIAGYAACGAQCATEKVKDIYDSSILEGPVIAKSLSLPVTMVCGCELNIENLVEHGTNDWRCRKCGYQYPMPEKGDLK